MASIFSLVTLELLNSATLSCSAQRLRLYIQALMVASGGNCYVVSQIIFIQLVICTSCILVEWCCMNTGNMSTLTKISLSYASSSFNCVVALIC